jgi:hypothetical protein
VHFPGLETATGVIMQALAKKEHRFAENPVKDADKSV